jgi:hypothetical protein
MSLFRNSKRALILMRCAPISDKPTTDRRMRAAVLHARRDRATAKEFQCQQAFDRAIAALVQDVPVSEEIAEWFRNEKLIPQKKRSWKQALRNPVVLSIATAVAVIAGIAVFMLLERMHEFPGSGTARKLLTVASSTRGTQLDPIQTDAGALNDFFFMKYRLEHYDVPPEFAQLRTAGARVFDDDEGHRVAQISVPEKRLQFFLFPADRNPKDATVREFSGWKFVEQEGWTGAVQQRAGVCFMAAVHGEQKDLAPYLDKPKQ